ncbi:glycosyltransferase [Candidatus Brachybacter algidus]|uniref:glycosyltransferase n=1 Tax=Candidatus Brachybacter algidus TaxID=2982024 RepID=UPI001D70B3C5|nr:glycosyltransferase [Candidatus Brachybacter algidus]MBK6450624.1 glycosyltransferase family 1 protein [Candidatus Brachybacter algidus]
MKILFCNLFNDPAHYMYNIVHGWINRLNKDENLNVDIDLYCTSLNIPGMRAPFKLLDIKWKSKDGELMKMYDGIINNIHKYDALINFGGVNLHPEFVKQLPVVTIWNFYDDPESSEEYSRYMSMSHDLCAVGNIASLDIYRTWGNKNVFWSPCGFRADDYDPLLTYENILSGQRENDITLLCERIGPFRRSKVDKFSLNFPQGLYYGNGWPNGFLPEIERIPLLQNTKIGINIHNSTGPINFRTFYLAANGVMQICDNKSHLGKIFNLNEEVVGYDTIEEAIELTKYYLNNDSERRNIAANGFLKVIKSYNETECFKIISDHIRNYLNQNSKQINGPINLGHKQNALLTLLEKIIYFLPKYWRAIIRRIIRLIINIKYWIQTKNR